MATRYDKLKTPYYKVEIFSPDGKRNVNLPHHILRLIESIKIIETINKNGEGKSDFNTVEMVFVEGSREPASTSASEGTKGLYQISNEGKGVDMRISGSITNRSGVITDLRFSGTNGITFATEEEIKTSRVDKTLQENVEGKEVTRTFPNEPTKPLFLFAPYNQIKITWGYLEDPKSKRAIRFRLKTVNSKFTDGNGVKTTIVGFDGGDDANTLVAPKSPKLVPPTPQGFSYVYRDPPTPEFLEKLTGRMGLDLLISPELPLPVMEDEYKKSWIAGESFEDFIARLASRHNCEYKFVINPATGKDTLVFISTEDFEAKPISEDRELFHYKAPGSILKSVDVQLTFNNLADVKKTTINSEGEKVSANTQTAVEQFHTVNGEKYIRNNYVEIGWVQQTIQDLFEGESATNVDVTPESNPDIVDNLAKKEVDVRSSNTAAITFTTMGFTRLTPGLVEFRGLGVRFSGYYRVKTIEHVISASGYTCKGFATSAFTSSEEGIEATGSKKKKKPEEKTQVRQFLDDLNQIPKESDVQKSDGSLLIVR